MGYSEESTRLMAVSRESQLASTRESVEHGQRKLMIDMHNGWALFDFHLEGQLIESAKTTTKGITP